MKEKCFYFTRKYTTIREIDYSTDYAPTSMPADMDECEECTEKTTCHKKKVAIRHSQFIFTMESIMKREKSRRNNNIYCLNCEEPMVPHTQCPNCGYETLKEEDNP